MPTRPAQAELPWRRSHCHARARARLAPSAGQSRTASSVGPSHGRALPPFSATMEPMLTILPKPFALDALLARIGEELAAAAR